MSMFVARFAAGIAFVLVYVFSAEMFPTTLRLVIVMLVESILITGMIHERYLANFPCLILVVKGSVGWDCLCSCIFMGDISGGSKTLDKRGTQSGAAL